VVTKQENTESGSAWRRQRKLKKEKQKGMLNRNCRTRESRKEA